MKSAGLHLFAFALAGSSLAAEDATTPGPAKTSSRLAQEIRVVLPKYAPPVPQPLNQPKELAGDPDALALPKVTVREKRLPRIDPDELLVERELNKKFTRVYRESLNGGLDRFLNSFTIPILSASPAERGRAIAVSRKFSDIGRIAELHKELDPKNAAELKAEVKQSERAMDRLDRPAGDGRAK